MTHCADAASNSAGRCLATAATVVAVLLAAGCASDINEGVGPASTAPSLSGSQPQNTGVYPNLNIRPQAAAEQINAEQRAAAGSRLTSASQRAQAGAAGQPISEAEKERLKKLAADNGASVLAEIEGKP